MQFVRSNGSRVKIYLLGFVFSFSIAGLVFKSDKMTEPYNLFHEINKIVMPNSIEPTESVEVPNLAIPEIQCTELSNRCKNVEGQQPLIYNGEIDIEDETNEDSIDNFQLKSLLQEFDLEIIMPYLIGMC